MDIPIIVKKTKGEKEKELVDLEHAIKKAINDYTEAIKQRPNYADAYFNRGILYRRLGNQEQAINDLLQAAIIYQEQGNQAGYERVQQAIKRLKK